MIFSPKQKLFQIPLAIVKQIKKKFKKIFFGVLGVLKHGVFCIFFAIFGTPKTPQKYFFLKKIFFLFVLQLLEVFGTTYVLG